MHNDIFTFAQAVFHVIVFIVIHGQRPRPGSQSQRQQRRRKIEIPDDAYIAYPAIRTIRPSFKRKEIT